MGEDLQTTVPLSLVGEAEGVKNEGGILEVGLPMKLKSVADPGKLPSAIELDISNLGLGENLQIKDLPEIDGVAYVTGEDTILVSCVGSASGRSGSGEDDDAEEHAEPTDAPENDSDSSASDIESAE